MKGKETANIFGLNEVTGIRKEALGAATGTTSLCLFSLPIPQNRFRGKEKVEGGIMGMSFEKMYL